MARTLDEIRASRPKVDRTMLRATTEADIHEQMIADGQDPNAPLPAFTKRLPGQRGPGKKPPKVLMTVRVDPAVLEAYKSSGPGWQRRVQDVLAQGAMARKRRA